MYKLFQEGIAQGWFSLVRRTNCTYDILIQQLLKNYGYLMNPQFVCLNLKAVSFNYIFGISCYTENKIPF